MIAGRPAVASVGGDAFAGVVGPNATQTRSMPVCSPQDVGDIGSTAGRTAGREARLTPNSARASRSRAAAVSARARWSAASWPTTTPTKSRRKTLSQLPGSAIASVKRGSVNRKL